MPRHHAPLLTSIWDDHDFQQLPALAQRLYMQILSQKRLSLAGVIPFSARNLARGCAELTPDDIDETITVLEAANYIFVDRDTEELMVRTMLKHDPPRGSRTITGMWNAWREIDSDAIKRRVIHNVDEQIWAQDGVDPPEAAKALRKALSDAPSQGSSMGHVENENQLRAATCHLPPTNNPHPQANDFHSSTRSTGDDEQPDDERINEVIEACIAHRMSKQTSIGNPKGYAASVRQKFTAQDRAEVGRLLYDFPGAPTDLIVSKLEGEDSRNLAMYARGQPEPDDSEPERLTAEQRATALAQGSAPERFTVIEGNGGAA